MLSGSADFLLPRECLLCRQSLADDEAICRWCVAALPGYHRQRCPVCAAPLEAAPSATEPAPPTKCRHCCNPDAGLDRTWVVADYARPLSQVIQRMKYRRQWTIATTMGRLIAQHDAARPALPQWPEILIPVAMPPARLAERGYNQSLLIARAIGRAWRIPVIANALSRADPSFKSPASQTSRSRRERLQALSPNNNPFRANPALVNGLRVTLVDDVITSGATLRACTHALRTAGATRITALAIARTRAPYD